MAAGIVKELDSSNRSYYKADDIVKLLDVSQSKACIMWRTVLQKRKAKDLTAEKHPPGKEQELKRLLITLNLRRFRELEL